MGTPDQQESNPISKKRFDRAVKKLLQAPPSPNGEKKPKAESQPTEKRKAKRS